MELDVLTDDPRWGDITKLAQRVLAAVEARLGIAGDVVLLATSDARIKGLNAEFRGKPQATNVLSWPAQDLPPAAPGQIPPAPQPEPDGSLPLGDIALAFETCRSEAEAADIALNQHATHLILHGFLHLLGYDHQTDADAALMEGLETEILGQLGLPDPYGPVMERTDD